MDSHLWALPWLSLIVGGATLAVALFRTLRTPIPENSIGFRDRLPAAAVWMLLVILGVLLELRVGSVQTADYMGARGLLLGAVFGALLVALGSRPTALPSLSILGIGLTEFAIGRLWLTHGEMTGLTAIALGTALAVLCLEIGAIVQGRGSTSIAGVVLAGTLSAAMQMGFTRAEQIDKEYWPDIPLIITAAIALGVLIAAGVSRGGRARIAAIIPVLTSIIAAWWCSRSLLHETTPVKLIVIGIVSAALIYLLGRQAQRWGMGLALVLLFAAISLGYAYWAGYGVTMLLIGAWSIYAAVEIAGADVDNVETGAANAVLLGPLAVMLIVALHRAVTLQNGDNLSSTDITDTWNLLAVGVGAVLPLACTPSIWSDTAANSENLGRSGSLAVLIRAVLALSVPTLLIAYLFATQASDALLVGAAISVAALSALRRFEPMSIMSGTFLSLFVLQAMPMIAQWKEPSRHLKVEILVAITVVCVIISLLPRRSQPATAEA